jgi:deoxyribodipyrimidine photo-lyase
MHVDQRRVRWLKEAELAVGPVVYWMSRDQRAHDNWALLYAMEEAKKRKTECLVIFCFLPHFLGAIKRQYDFMLAGLEQVESILKKKDISFTLLKGEPAEEIPAYLRKKRAGLLVMDFDPLKIKKTWKKQVAKGIDIPMVEVDAHNIVPCWVASDHQEFGAYTLRPKIRKLLPDFLIEYPKTFSGMTDGLRALHDFIEQRLTGYAEKRNDPTIEGQSSLSPYLHFGQLSAQRVAWEVRHAKAPMADRDAFLEELIVRKELSDNFCEYNPHYDSVLGFPDWAKRSHAAHQKDKREYLYTRKQFEEGKTHDDLWNAAQMQMVNTGKMHGYMRMYWAKKILEWTKSPEEAMKIAIYLNDTYSLDGRDPNGYAGIAWSIGGVHDRAWVSRPVFGQIRYMNRNGCERKFDVDAYIGKWLGKGQARLGIGA